MLSEYLQKNNIYLNLFPFSSVAAIHFNDGITSYDIDLIGLTMVDSHWSCDLNLAFAVKLKV